MAEWSGGAEGVEGVRMGGWADVRRDSQVLGMEGCLSKVVGVTDWWSYRRIDGAEVWGVQAAAWACYY